MPNLDKAFRVSAVSFDDQLGIFQGAIDPSAGVGFEAPLGSLFLQNTGKLWKKFAAPDASWEELVAVGGGGAGLSIITSFVGLPISPTLNDLVFYTPFNTVARFDGTHWVGPKISESLFGRGGKIKASFWLHGVGNSKPFFSPTTQQNGYLFKGPAGSGYKFYQIEASNREPISGTIELHNTSSLALPDFLATGIIKATFVNSLTASFEDAAGSFVASGALLQCFLNRTTNTNMREIIVRLTYSEVAQ